MPVELWTPKGLSYIASAIGKPLFANSTTLARKRLTFARVCIEVEAGVQMAEEILLASGNSADPILDPSTCSWTWRKVLQLRPVYRPLIKTLIGDGRHTSLWFDNWLPFGPIHQRMGDRVIYDAGLPRQAMVASIILEHSWRWPLANSTELLELKNTTSQLPYTPSGAQERIYWLPTASTTVLHSFCLGTHSAN